MQELITMILNNGIGVVCVAYLIYFQSTTMKKISENQEKNNELLQMMTNRLENLERKFDK
jgi:formate/nitrite transporter FocA (FNT family)